MTSRAPRAPASALAVAAALLIVYVVWGSTYFAIAVMIETLPPLMSAGVRYAVAGAVLLGGVVAVARWRGRRADGQPRVERPTGVEWRSAVVVGTLLLLGGNGGVVLSELYIPSGITAVLVATVPIWLSLFESIVTRRPPSRLVIGGLIAGIVGVAVLLVPIEGLEQLDPLGVGLVVVATISWAIGSLYARRAPLPRNGLVGTGMEMLGGGAALLLGGLALGELGRADPSAFSLRSLLALGYLVIFGSILAFSAYTWLLNHVAVSTVATYAYVNPIVAVALGALFLGEEITLRTLIASAIVIGAVVAMVSGRPREAEESPPATAPTPRAADALADDA